MARSTRGGGVPGGLQAARGGSSFGPEIAGHGPAPPLELAEESEETKSGGSRISTMTSLWQDLVHGFQMLLQKPALTAVAALSLALGIGANTVIFSLINGTLLRPLAFADPDRLVVVWKTPIGHPDQRNNPNVSTYFAIRDHNSSFESVGAFNGAPANLGAEQNGAPAERINGQTFSPSMFKVIGVQPRLGRIFTDDEDQVDNAALVVIISDRLWQSHFNRDPNVVGKMLIMDKMPITVIGVMPAGFTFFNDDTDFWAPLPLSRLQ